MPAAGTAPHATVVLAGGVEKVGSGAGDTVIVLDTGASVLPQRSVAFHVSIIVPPHAPGGTWVDIVETAVPLSRQPEPPPLV